MPAATSPSRRFTSRLHAHGEVWVYWQCHWRKDVSRVLNLSPGGLFIEALKPLAMGASANLHFLVQEGPIRVDAIVRHVKPGIGLGLKFTSVSKESGPQLATLLARLHHLHRAQHRS